MEQRILTAATVTLSTAQSRIRTELGNFPSGPTKFTVIHRRPVNSQLTQKGTSPLEGHMSNTMCRFSHHPPASDDSKTTPIIKDSSLVNLTKQKPNAVKSSSTRSSPCRLKRSLSSDNFDIFGPVPQKRPFPVQIWFNRPSGPRLPVATAHWQDSPLHDSLGFVYTKLLEASQARRYLQLQSKPRKYLHLTGGGIHSVIPTPPSVRPGNKPEIVLPPMMVKLAPPLVTAVNGTNNIRPSSLTIKPIVTSASTTPVVGQRRKSSFPIPHHSLPPPPPLISLQSPSNRHPLLTGINSNSNLIRRRGSSTMIPTHLAPLQEVERPALDVSHIKRRKPSVVEDDDRNDSPTRLSSSPDSPRLVIHHSSAPSSSPLNLATHHHHHHHYNNDRSSSTVTGSQKRKTSVLPITIQQHHQSSFLPQDQPLDLATPSPTSPFKRMSLGEVATESRHHQQITKQQQTKSSTSTDPFLLRLVLVLQVLLGQRRLAALGHPNVPVEDLLDRVLRKAGIVPVKDVRSNWLKFLRLCVKNEEAWKREGWDSKSADEILNEIYNQGNVLLLNLMI